MKKLFLFLSFCLSTGLLYSQVNFRVEVNSDSILLGNQLLVTFTLENGRGQAFEPPVFEGFVLVGGPNQSSSFSMINGEISQSLSYSYYLQPEEVGEFYIPPASIEVDGKVLETEPLTIKVAPNPNGEVISPRRSAPSNPFFQPAPKPKKPKKKRRIYRL